MTVRRLCMLLSCVAAAALAPSADAAAPASGLTPDLRPTPPADALTGFDAPQAATEHALEERFDAQIAPADLGGWLRRLSSAPNQVGSPHDFENAQWQLAQFKSWGWDAHIERFDILYPTPLSERLELLGARPFRAGLHEPAIAGDPSTRLPGQLPPYLAYQGDGDVTGALVYVNYGMPADYVALERMGVDVRGKIVITRYGGGWRGLKPKLAQEHGAIGCIIYSDPAQDGYVESDVYPKGAERPPQGVQRGSVQDVTLYPGDPLTPGIGATADAKRLTRATAPTLLKIPALPISYGDALPFLAALQGAVAPRNWRGGLPITYHVGGVSAGAGATRVHLAVKSDWSLKPIYDVIATLQGAQRPDEWVVRGNHHDGWVFGASDPMSGQVALMAEAKAIGALVKGGWRPARTLIYASWDAEEPGLIGSTEWAETHAAELQKHAVVYVNSDDIDRGFLRAGGSAAFARLVGEASRDVRDPETGRTLAERLRARLQVEGWEGGDAAQKKLAKIAASDADLPIAALGSGSDFSSFLQHLGVASLDIGFGGEGLDDGVYHSAYDTYAHYSRFGDPGEAYGATLARTVGRIVLRASQADVAPMRFTAVAESFATELDDLKTLARTRRERVETLNRLVDTRAFRLAADPETTTIAPSREGAVAQTDFGPLDEAIATLATSAHAYDAALALHDARTPSATRVDPTRVDARLIGMEQTLLEPRGLPGRPWFRNLAYAPGVLTGYGAKTFPGVREALEADQIDLAAEYLQLTAAAVTRYATALDAATTALGKP